MTKLYVNAEITLFDGTVHWQTGTGTVYWQAGPGTGKQVRFIGRQLRFIGRLDIGPADRYGLLAERYGLLAGWTWDRQTGTVHLTS